MRERSVLPAALVCLSWIACGGGGAGGSDRVVPVDIVYTDTVVTEIPPPQDAIPADLGADAPVAEAADPGPAVDPGIETDPGPASDPGPDPDSGLDVPPTDPGPDVPATTGCPASGVLPAGVTADPDGRTWSLACGNERSIRVTAWADGIVRLRHAGNPAATDRSWAVTGTPDASLAATAGTEDGRLLVCSGGLEVRLDPNGCRIEVRDAKGTVVLEDAPGASWQTWMTPEAGPATKVRHAAPVGDRFFGFGERTGPLDRRGRSMEFWNSDTYQEAYAGYAPDQDPLYQSIPFVLGTRSGTAWGVLVDDPHHLFIDAAATESSVWSAMVLGGEIDEFVVAGPRPADVLRRYTDLTGRAPLPPRWSLGFSQSRWGWTPDDRVREVAQEFRDRGLPCDALWLDIQHMDRFRCFTWDPVAFDDPAALIADLDALGFRTLTIQDPCIAIDPTWDVYSSGLDAGAYLSNGDGTPFVGKVWPGECAFPDFSDPDARAWWAGLLTEETDLGVDGLWIDMNEPTSFQPEHGGTVPDYIAADGDGSPTDMAEIHNVYALLEAKASFEGLLAARPDERPFLLTRAGYAGIQRYAAVWTGDAPSRFDVLKTTLPMLLNLGLSGVPLTGSDIGGYGGNASPELFARWMELGSVSPLARAHVRDGVPDQEPWAFGTEVTDITRDVLSLRYELLPYWYSLFDEAARTGAPPLRPVFWEFPAQEPFAATDDEAMIGPWILVAPVLEEGATERVVKLPPGRWFELRSGAVVEGPATFSTPVTLAALPLYVREGAIVPRGPALQRTDEAPLSPLTLDVYPGPSETRTTLYEDDGLTLAHASGAYSRVEYRTVRLPDGARLTAGQPEGTYEPPARTVVVRVRRVDHPVQQVELDGKTLSGYPTRAALDAAGTGWWQDEADLSLVVAFPDHAPFSLTMRYDPALTAPAPDVPMTFVVKTPAGTPHTTDVTIATSANGWTHAPLAWTGTDTASATVLVPRGQWVFYKYARGSWDSVEKWPGCVEATNRYAFGAAHPVKQDEVWAWADLCR